MDNELYDPEVDDLDESSYFQVVGEEDDSGGDEESSDSDLSRGPEAVGKTDEASYEGKLPEEDIWLIKAYDKVVSCEKSGPKGNADLQSAATIILHANPVHSSDTTVGHIIQEMFHTQGRYRRENRSFVGGFLRSEDIARAGIDDADIDFNDEFTKIYQEHINNFIQYLATRDLSGETSKCARDEKLRHLPAFLIFLFTTGSYGYLIDCPTLPPEYKEQVDRTFKMIERVKGEIIEGLASEYENRGRTEVAVRVRTLGPTWFSKEPAELKSKAEHKDLGLTNEDIDLYRIYRSRWINTTVSITQDLVSDTIRVVRDKRKGIYEYLKDKTRAKAINEVKKIFETWSKDQGQNGSELAKKLIFK